MSGSAFGRPPCEHEGCKKEGYEEERRLDTLRFLPRKFLSRRSATPEGLVTSGHRMLDLKN